MNMEIHNVSYTIHQLPRGIHRKMYQDLSGCLMTLRAKSTKIKTRTMNQHQIYNNKTMKSTCHDSPGAACDSLRRVPSQTSSFRDHNIKGSAEMLGLIMSWSWFTS